MRSKIFKKLFLVSFLVLATWLLSFSTSLAVSPALTEDFNDNATDPTLWSISQVGFGPTVAETNQRLEMNLPWDSADDPLQGAFKARCVSTFQLRGDFDVQVDYQLINWPYSNGVRIGLFAGPAVVERTSFGDLFNDFYDQPREVYLMHASDGVQGITETSDTTGKLRLVRSGDTISGYCYNAGSWTLIYTAYEASTDVYINLEAWSHDGVFMDQDVSLAFDNFVVNQGQLIFNDSTAPTVTITTPANGIEYLLNQLVLAGWTATDAGSGITSVTATTANGEPIDTALGGTKTFTVAATDRAGNQTTETVTYYVRYVYGGVLQPINHDDSSIFKIGNGRVIPVKFQLTDANGNYVSTAVARLNYAKVNDDITGTTYEANITGQANTDNLFRYDSASNQYIYNLDTNALTTGTWELQISLDDGTTKKVTISVK